MSNSNSLRRALLLLVVMPVAGSGQTATEPPTSPVPPTTAGAAVQPAAILNQAPSDGGAGGRPSLVLTAGRSLALRGGDGAVTFTVTNNAPTAATLAIAPGAIADADTHAVVTKARATFSTAVVTTSGIAAPSGAAGTSATSALPATLAPGQTTAVQANVTGATGVSEAELPIYNSPPGAPVSGNALLGTLHLEAQDAPLNLAVEGEGSTSTPLTYAFSQPVSLVLKDGDAEAYALHWEFLIDNRVQSSGELHVPANGSVRVPLKAAGCPERGVEPPECTVYSALDRMHPSVKQGVLILSLADPGGGASGLLPSRAVPVTLRMQRIAPTASNALSYMYASVLLFLGGLLSVIAGSVLPNMQAKSNLRAELKDLANRTTSLSTRIDSYLRVLLRLERKRIEIAITDATVWLPTATEPLTPITDAMATLTRRLTAAEILDDLRRKHDAVAESAPPSVTDCIDTTLQAAADQLHSLTLSPAELTAANALLLKAKTWLDMLDDPDALSKLIAANLFSLRARIAKFPAEYSSDLVAALPGLWVIVDPARGFDDAKNIVRPMFFAIDHGIAAIHLALDFAMVRASIPVDGTAPPSGDGGAGPAPETQQRSASTRAPASPPLKAPAEGGPAAAADPKTVAPANSPTQPKPFSSLASSQRERLLKQQPVLMELLGTLSWRALREATQLVAQMREDIYEQDVLNEIGKPGQAELTFDTQKPRPYLPVFFAITFKDRRYNGTAALQRMICHWTFPDGLEEQGWKVCHYFSGDEKPNPSPAAAAQPAPADSPTEPDPESDAPSGLLSRLGKPRLPPINTIEIHATIRGQRAWESLELPVPPLSRTIQIQRTPHREPTRYVPEVLRFVIAFGIALAGLLSGALGQLEKLDFLPATIAVLALGFGADSIKNLLTQAPRNPTADRPGHP